MDMILNTVLKGIEGELILNIEGKEQSCKSSDAALDAINSAVVYVLQKIGVKDGKVYIEVCDERDVITRQNMIWMKAEKARSGVEPSFF